MADCKIRGGKKIRAFLAAYRICGNIAEAARVAKVHRRTHYDWLEKVDGYRAAFESAEGEAIDALEAEARRRALHGTDEPVFYRGKKVGSVRRYSDKLLCFLLRGARPDKYRDRTTIHRGHLDVNHSGEIKIAIQDALNELDNKPGFADYARSIAAGGDTGLLCGVGQQRTLAAGPAPGGDRPGSNGHHPGSNGKHPGH